MNPADAFRKEQHKKEMVRNKMERKFLREARTKLDDPDEIKTELQELIDAEEAGPLGKPLKLRKKVLQDAYEKAIRKRKVGAVMVLLQSILVSCVCMHRQKARPCRNTTNCQSIDGVRDMLMHRAIILIPSCVCLSEVDTMHLRLPCCCVSCHAAGG